MATLRVTPTEPLLSIEGVSKSFDGALVLEQFSLEVYGGEFVSLLGPSGCGKSTLLRILAGFERPDAGRILVRGRDLARVPPFQRDAAMVVQHFALFPHLSVQANVEFGLEMRGVPAGRRREEALAALDMVGLGGLGARRVDQLSGGQRQRVALARALVTRPSMLLLDEPLGALDANLRVKMQAELKRLNKRLGITFILVTGNQSEALAMSDRIVVMNRGRVEQVGTPHEVFRAPKTEFVARFLGHYNVIPGQVAGVAGGYVQVETEAGPLLAPVGAIRLPAGVGSPPAGAPCSVLVRIDQMQIGEPAAGGEPCNRLTGRLVDREFTGSLLTYRMAVGDGIECRLEKHRSVEKELGGNSLLPGAQVTLVWPAADTQLIVREGGAC